LKIDGQAEFRFMEKAFVPEKSKIRNPKSKITSSNIVFKVVQRRMGRALKEDGFRSFPVLS